MLSRTTRTLILTSSLVAFLNGAAAFAQVSPQQSGNITYITGGIGQDETTALRAVQRDYNLHVLSSSISGHFVGDAPLTISDSKGNPLLTTDAGPIFYAKLPAGTYIVEANRNGEIKKQRVTVGKSSARVNFAWKEAPEDTLTTRGEASSAPLYTPSTIPPLGTTNERISGTLTTEPPAVPPAEIPPAPVYQATPIR